MIKNKKAIAGMLVAVGVIAGAVGSVGIVTHAQTATTTATPIVTSTVQATTSQVDVSTSNDPQDVPDINDKVDGQTDTLDKNEVGQEKEDGNKNEAPETEVPDAQEAGK
jgi:hypothetical protein